MKLTISFFISPLVHEVPWVQVFLEGPDKKTGQELNQAIQYLIYELEPHTTTPLPPPLSIKALHSCG